MQQESQSVGRLRDLKKRACSSISIHYIFVIKTTLSCTLILMEENKERLMHSHVNVGLGILISPSSLI